MNSQCYILKKYTYYYMNHKHISSQITKSYSIYESLFFLYQHFRA